MEEKDDRLEKVLYAIASKFFLYGMERAGSLLSKEEKPDFEECWNEFKKKFLK